MGGHPALAVSLRTGSGVPDEQRHWRTAASMAVDIARDMLADRAPARTVFNLNVPDLPREALGELKICALGSRHYMPSVIEATDPRGRRIHWVGGVSDGFADQVGSDGYWLERGHPTLTPLLLDGTDHSLLAHWQGRSA
jgi:5'-nucleotidase